MTKPNGLLVAMMIAGLIAGGCSINAPVIDPAICEYPPAKLPGQVTINEPCVFALVQWTATGPATRSTGKQSGESSTDYPSAKQLKSDVCVNMDESIGFRLQNDQLIAFAGKTAIPLAPGHYSWVLISSPANSKRPPVQKPLDLEEAIWLATVGAVISGAVWWWIVAHASAGPCCQNQ